MLGAWSSSAVDAHLEGDYPWAPYHETMRETVAALVGARSGEAVVMNSLTVNLHLMLRSFYRPTAERYRIVIEADVFPSDRYAVMGVARAHGLDPADAVVILTPRPGERHLRTEDVAGYLQREGGSVAVVVLSAVDFRTGAFLDLPAITDAAHRAGAFMGWDLAHAAGNVPVRLHDWDVDFAVWCHYKYVNSGPGAVGGCFVHERHGTDPSLVRPGGWWGHDPVSRFAMPFAFAPVEGAEGWQISNPPILAMAPVRVSLALFAEVGLDRLRERSVRLTVFLERLLDAVAARRPIEVITPRDPERRGAQLSVMVDDAAAVTEDLFARAPGEGGRPAARTSSASHPHRSTTPTRTAGGPRSPWTTCWPEPPPSVALRPPDAAGAEAVPSAGPDRPGRIRSGSHRPGQAPAGPEAKRATWLRER